MFEPKLFYQTFLTDYHKMKIIPIRKILNDLPKFEQEFFGKELNSENREAYKRMLKSELRQAYFHCIETFFEIFFALDPTGKGSFEDEFILFNITNSNPKENYNRIKDIATSDIALDFLDMEIIVRDRKITVGHYIFYFGIFSKEKFPSNTFEDIKESLQAIKFGIRYLAKDFAKREEYNSYKHGLRIIPALKKIMFAKADTKEIEMNWDFSDSMSFYLKTKDPNELEMITKIFDSERDYLMSYFCSNLIHNMIYYRRVSMFKESIKEKEVPVPLFGKKEIEEFNKDNVEIKEFVWSLKRQK